MKTDKNFWLLNGWLLALLILVVFMLHFVGVLEAFHHAKVECDLGDGFFCLETYIYTPQTKSESTGNHSDKISFFILNTMDRDVYNFSISLPNCYGLNQQEIVKKNELITYNATNCLKLIPDGFFRSEVIIRYDVIQNQKKFDIISKGYISNYVNSPKKESIDQTISRKVGDWVKNNVG